MEAMYPSKRDCFCYRFHTADQDIANGLSASQSDASNEHWKEGSEFCRDVSLNHLLVLYRYLVPVLNTFVRQ